MTTVDVTLIYAPADRGVALEVAQRLERVAQARVWHEEGAVPVNERWDEGLASAGALLLLSPDSVPKSPGREPWDELLAHTGAPPVAKLLVRDCRYPPLLERTRFFRWSDSDVLRQLHRWAISLHGNQPRQPAGSTESCDTEELWLRLVDQTGVVRVVDALAARQFAHEAAPWFREVIVVPCSGRSLPMILGEIALAMRLTLRGTVDDACEQVGAAVAGTRILLVLEGMDSDAPFVWDGEASVLYAPAGEPGPAPSDGQMLGAFVHWPSRGDECVLYVPHIEQAILASEWSVASRLGKAAFAFLKNHDRVFEAAHVARLLERRASTEGEESVTAWAAEELSWITGGERVFLPRASGEQMTLFA